MSAEGEVVVDVVVGVGVVVLEGRGYEFWWGVGLVHMIQYYGQSYLLIRIINSQLTIMIRLVTIFLLLWSGLSTCAGECLTCSKQNNAYSCNACVSYRQMFLTSCPLPQNQAPFLAIGIILLLLHFFMLAMGIGIYRQIFQLLQIGCIISWRYGAGRGTTGLVVTNLTLINGNYFFDTFGYQFLTVLIVLAMFWFVFVIVDRIPHSPTAVLLRRKRFTFPVRLITLTFNATVYASFAQLSTISTQINILVFPLICGVIALVAVIFALVVIAVVANIKSFQPDDPNYYVFVQQLTAKKWYARNSLLFSLFSRLIILAVFTGLFSYPQVSGVIMIIVQAGYLFYFVGLIRFTKIRYMVVLIAGHVLFLGILAVSYIGAISTIESPIWNSCGIGYMVFLILMCAIYFFGSIIQIIIKKDVIVKQIKSMYSRFIKCQKLDDNVIRSKYDQNSHRQRVTQFKSNLLYKQNSAAKQKIIEMVEMQ